MNIYENLWKNANIIFDFSHTFWSHTQSTPKSMQKSNVVCSKSSETPVIHAYIHAYKHAYIHTYIHTYTHMHTYIQIHTNKYIHT